MNGHLLLALCLITALAVGAWFEKRSGDQP
jgi:hypothetical protein